MDLQHADEREQMSWSGDLHSDADGVSLDVNGQLTHSLDLGSTRRLLRGLAS